MNWLRKRMQMKIYIKVTKKNVAGFSKILGGPGHGPFALSALGSSALHESRGLKIMHKCRRRAHKGNIPPDNFSSPTGAVSICPLRPNPNPSRSAKPLGPKQIFNGGFSKHESNILTD